jgi:hypothetical protein
MGKNNHPSLHLHEVMASQLHPGQLIKMTKLIQVQGISHTGLRLNTTKHIRRDTYLFKSISKSPTIINENVHDRHLQSTTCVLNLLGVLLTP